MSRQSRRTYRFGLFEADPASGELLRLGARVRLQDQPFRVLCLLLERAGEVVTREELRQALWPAETYVEFDGSLNAVLKRLRAALGDSADNPIFVETLPKRGYRFIAPIAGSLKTEPSDEPNAIIEEAKAAPMEVAANTTPSFSDGPALIQTPALSSESRARYVPYAVVLTVILLLAFAWGLGRKRLGGMWFGIAPRAEASAIPVRESVAVLGFHNVSGNAEDAWLGTAFSEMLSTELSSGEKLRLVSGEDVATLRQSSPWSQTGTLGQGTTARVGGALNADLLVLGSYAAIGKDRAQLRLDVRLQDARSGAILTEFAETGSSQDLFQLVSQVGGKLREKLGVSSPSGSDEAGVLASLPLDREAARFYSLGVAKLRQFDLQSAKDLLLQACVADPKFSLAHLMLARAWSGLGYEQKRKEETKKALDLATDLPRAMRMLVEGDYYESLSDHERAISSYRVLFELFPDSVEYGLLLGGAQHAAGHDNEASETIARLRRLPLSASDDPRIDLLEARTGQANDPARLVLIHSAERKAAAQGRKMIYAQARKEECLNLNYSEHPEQALPACEEAYHDYLAAGNRMMAADALRLIGDVQGSLGQNDQAVATYQRALKMLEELGEHYKTGAVLNNMAIHFANEGKLDRAEQLYRQAKVHFEQAGDKGNIATALANIADIFFLRGDLPGAEKLYDQAMDIENSLDQSEPVYLLGRLSDLALTQGRVADALRLAQQAVAAGRRHQGAYGSLSSSIISLGEALKAEGDLQGSRQQFEEALKIRQKLGDMEQVEESQEELADLDLEEGRADQAEPLLRQAIAEFEKGKWDLDAVSAYTLFSRALLMEGRLDEARQAIRHAAELSRSSPDPGLKLPVAVQAARIEMAASLNETTRPSSGGAAKKATAQPHIAPSAVRHELLSIAALAKKLGYYDLECEARLALGEFELKTNPSAKEAIAERSRLKELASDSHNRGMLLVSRKASDLAEGATIVATAATG